MIYNEREQRTQRALLSNAMSDLAAQIRPGTTQLPAFTGKIVPKAGRSEFEEQF